MSDRTLRASPQPKLVLEIVEKLLRLAKKDETGKLRYGEVKRLATATGLSTRTIAWVRSEMLRKEREGSTCQ